MNALRVDQIEGDAGEWFRIRYRPARYRPLTVYLWVDCARVGTELAEATENHLDGRSGRAESRVRNSLSSVVEVAAVEVGLFQLEDMGLVIAGQVAEYLCAVGAGLIRDTDDEWWALRSGRPWPVLGRE